MRQLNFLKKWGKVDDKKKSSTEEIFRLNSLQKQRISWNCYTCSNKQMSNNHTCVVDAHGLKSCSGFLMFYSKYLYCFGGQWSCEKYQGVIQFLCFIRLLHFN
jgi:hypothetical protein